MAWLHKLTSSRAALFAALAAAILGGKFLLIGKFGSDLPFWDQWDAEGNGLIRPFLEGHLSAGDLLAAHNEHRIVFTRLMALGLFVANGDQWDALVEMVANAALHAGFAVLLALFALEFLPAFWVWIFAALMAVFFTAPAAWENILGGFQSQFYFLFLFSALHIGGTLAARPGSPAWRAAPLAGVAAVFSMGSGFFSAAALLSVLGLGWLRDRRLSRPDLVMLAANAALLGLGLLARVAVPEHDSLQSAGVGSWPRAFWHEFSWPVGSGWAAGLNLAPPLFFAWGWWRRRSTAIWTKVLLAGCVWSGLQIAALAYARGAVERNGFTSRYTDLLSIGWLLGLLTLAGLARGATSPRGRWAAYAVLLAYGVAGIAGLSARNTLNEHGFLLQLPGFNRARVAAVRGYLTSHGAAFFDKSPGSELPYPNANRLAALLDVPALRDSLPPDAVPAPRSAGPLSWLAGRVIRHGAWLLEAAGVFTLFGLLRLAAESRLARRPGDQPWNGRGPASPSRP